MDQHLSSLQLGHPFGWLLDHPNSSSQPTQQRGATSCSICDPMEMPLPTTAPTPSCTSVDYSHLWEKPPGRRRKRGSHSPAAFWKASMAWLRPGREARSCRAPIWVCSAPRLKRTLPFSKARALWWDGTPVRESYLEKGRANSCSSPGHSPQIVPVMVHKKCPRSWKRGWSWMILKVLSNLNYSMIPMDAGGA